MKSRLDNFWSDYLADPASLSQSQALPKFLWEEGISPKYRKQIWATVRPRPEPLFETKTDSREERDTVIRAARAQVEANVKPELQTSAQDGLIPEVSEETTARILRVVARFVEENCLESYQQGLATLTYTVLLVAGNDEQVAVDVLKVLGERVLPFRMRDNERLKQDVLILADLLVQDLPEVAAALNTASIDVVDLSDVLCSWFEATFASFFPHYAIQRLLDIALLEGMHNWFAFAYGLFQVSKNPLIEVEPRKLFQIVVSMPKLSEPQLQEAFAAGYENVRANADKVEELRAGRSWSKLMEVPGTVGFVRGVGMPDMVAAVRAERMLDVDTKEVLSQRNIGRSSVAETGDASAEQGGGTEATGGDDDDRANDADTADDPAQEQDSAGGGDDGNDEDSSRTGGQQAATASAGAHRSRLGSDELEMEMEQPHRESLQIVLNQHVSMEQPDLLLRLETIRGTTMDPGVAAIVGDAQAEIRRQTSSILELQDELKQREATWQQERQRLLSEAHRGNRRGRGGDSLEDSEMSYSASDEEDDYSDRYGGGSGGAGDDSSMMGDSDWSEDVSGNDRAGSSESLGSGGDTLATPVHRRRGGKKKKKAVVLQPGMVPYSKLFQYQQFPCIYMEGYLLKARKKTMAPGRRPTTGLFGNLHRRFFVLQGSFITYFKSHRNLTPSKDVSIDMAGRQVRRLENHKFGKYGFEITGVNSDECLYLLFASNADERNVWVQVLQAATET